MKFENVGKWMKEAEENKLVFDNREPADYLNGDDEICTLKTEDDESDYDDDFSGELLDEVESEDFEDELDRPEEEEDAIAMSESMPPMSQRKRIEFEDDIVRVYDGNKEIYAGAEDYEPMQDEDWKWDNANKYYKFGKYIKVCCESAQKNEENGLDMLKRLMKKIGDVKIPEFIEKLKQNKIKGESAIYTESNDDWKLLGNKIYKLLKPIKYLNLLKGNQLSIKQLSVKPELYEKIDAFSIEFPIKVCSEYSANNINTPILFKIHNESNYGRVDFELTMDNAHVTDMNASSIIDSISNKLSIFTDNGYAHNGQHWKFTTSYQELERYNIDTIAIKMAKDIQTVAEQVASFISNKMQERMNKQKKLEQERRNALDNMFAKDTKVSQALTKDDVIKKLQSMSNPTEEQLAAVLAALS